MIQRKNENWFRMLFIWQGSVLPKILPRLALLFMFTVAVVYFKNDLFYKIPLNPAPFTLFGIALALFLGFRNTASYDRFWEGRKLWGALLNDTRSLARQFLSLSPYERDSKETTAFINLLIALVYALKHQLRKTDAGTDLYKYLDANTALELSDVHFKPVILMNKLAAMLKEARQKGEIDSITLVAFDQNLDKLSDIIGGCERLASTPIPYTYKLMLHRTVYLYCFLLPFGFVDSLAWMTPVVVTFIAYTFVGFEAIADEIEEPFGLEPNDLPLDTITRMIESTLLEMTGRPMPEHIAETGFILT
ncbi:bestrophin family protein [Pedobacter duraquae]|uniref:Putative membrane protein n=1 Tax=Pedobacter duraquae TaxID=425511 RepID=A0A4R6ILP9_9SPHI|nr:bestrophin family ion channel [Pedobacter duraquae]TDO22886.1 putative membrane protein [Pedobacter duraquae]